MLIILPRMFCCYQQQNSPSPSSLLSLPLSLPTHPPPNNNNCFRWTWVQGQNWEKLWKKPVGENDEFWGADSCDLKNAIHFLTHLRFGSETWSSTWPWTNATILSYLYIPSQYLTKAQRREQEGAEESVAPRRYEDTAVDHGSLSWEGSLTMDYKM